VKTNTSFNPNKAAAIEDGYDGITLFFRNKSEMTEISIEAYNSYTSVAQDFEGYRANLEKLYDDEPDLTEKGRKTVLAHLEEGLELMVDAKAGALHLYSVRRAIRALSN
jgi:hypothetical protein